ncbi:hypothetical protein ACQR05_25955 [Bradyrhizobium oligotrophicum]|uniref:hypothetical protein n=1 Tax=Bradyrhizobium oligotrophicum TaxID=44255 RepID=UPI003EBF6926
MRHLADDGSKQAGPRGEREAAEKPTAQGMPVDRQHLWYLPPAFFSQAGHGLRPAPGIPCALFVEGGPNDRNNSGEQSREVAEARRSVGEMLTAKVTAQRRATEIVQRYTAPAKSTVRSLSPFFTGRGLG